ncbi:Isoflavone reductase-like protein [Vitis vinifera]|uniref:Isoflavone reductase-like protein n=1 Tax=Vitis vinifera TaxID=29760 RepID=A0A438JTK8_VITVI|nr:Isoflavone reductase-like protein [Vitis vinifera]
MSEKSKILIIGGTGYIGKFIVAASAKSGHPTFALVRESTVSEKFEIIESFKSSGVTLVYGDLYDHESLVKAIKQVDVVISTVGHAQLPDQVKIIAAIKEAGNVKRFFPSEFGNDVDRVHAVEPAKTAFATKAQIRRTIEAEGIPYTYVSSNFFAGYFLPSLSQPGATTPQEIKVAKVVEVRMAYIPSDQNVAILNLENPSSLPPSPADQTCSLRNKAFQQLVLWSWLSSCEFLIYIYIMTKRPEQSQDSKAPQNTYSFNDLVSLWEKKIGKTLEKIYVPEEQVLKNIQEASVPLNVILSISHSVFIKGDHTNFEIQPSFGVEATELYPDVKYTTVDEYLNQFV